MDPQQFDVFFSYNARDKFIVEELASRLVEKASIRPWFDKWQLVPGTPWQPAIEEALLCSRSCAVVIGPSGSGPWQTEELQVAISRRAASGRAGFRVIPVILPGADAECIPGSIFLMSTTAVQFQTMDDPSAFDALVSGIRGAPPGPPHRQSADIRKESTGERWVIVLSATLKEVDKPVAEAIAEHLRKLSGDASLTIRKISQGSVIILLESSEEAAARIEQLFKADQLKELAGLVVQGVYPGVSGYGSGTRVEHAKFGHGTVVYAGSERILIKFDDHGEKKFVTALVLSSLKKSSKTSPDTAAKASKKRTSAIKPSAR